MQETDDLLKNAKIPDLKLILISSRLSTKGGKEELISRISDNCSDETIRQYLEKPRYISDYEYNSLMELSRVLKIEKKLKKKRRKYSSE